ncbi:MAG TPA: tetratricopeptide repeat protein [Terriglobia bacterium]|nr:tetratricopeptide repeat protein [Terriglobia bacterium]
MAAGLAPSEVRVLILLFLLLAALASLPLRGASGATTTRYSIPAQARAADDYFLGRQNLVNVRHGIDLLRDAIARDSQDYESWWRLARFYNFWGRRAPDSEKIRLLKQAVECGKKAVALQPNRVEGHFWLGASYGLLAEESNLLEGLRLIDPVRYEMETVVRIDQDYAEGSALQILGRVDYSAPFFKGGDKQRSIQLLEECLKKHPDNPQTMLYLADSYLAVGRRPEARTLLEKILTLCPDPQYGPEVDDYQAEARHALARNFRTGK